MNLLPDRQGYLGDLMNKSIPQLIELLERQEKLLLKRKFLESLPDKGERTRQFSIYLKQLIEQKSGDSKTSSADSTETSKVFQTSLPTENTNTHNIMDITSDKRRANCDIAKHDSNVKKEVNKVETVIDTNMTAMLDSSTSLLSSLEKMSIGSSNQNTQAEKEHYINSYERVIKKAEEAQLLTQKPKFLPNRTLLHDLIPESPYVHDTRPKKFGHNEESAAKPPHYKFQKSQLISIEESVKLIEQQKALNEELITKRTAKKLADQLLPKMDVYSPLSTDMQYRAAREADEDSDDDSNNDEGSQDGDS